LQNSADAEVGFGLSVTATSLFLLPVLLSGFLGSTLAGSLGQRRGLRLPLSLGLTMVVAGYALPALMLNSFWVLFIGSLLMQGFGLNLVYTGLANLVVTSAPRAQAAEAMGMNTSARTTGGMIGTQVLGVLIAQETQAGYGWAFGVCAISAGIALAAMMAGRREGVAA
jgi:MFS family permease